MGSDGNGNGAVTKCGLVELTIFIAAIVTGTMCSICSKTMMELHAVGSGGELELFEKPIFQTFGMFVGMTFGLVMHWAVLRFSIPFPGYNHGPPEESKAKNSTTTRATEQTALLSQKQNILFYFLAVPAFFDLGATALCMLGRKCYTGLLIDMERVHYP